MISCRYGKDLPNNSLQPLNELHISLAYVIAYILGSLTRAIMSEEVLPATTPRYQYQGIEQCLRILEQEVERFAREGGNPYVIVFDVDERSFLKCFVNSEDLTSSWVTYNDSASTLHLIPSYTSAYVYLSIRYYTQIH